MRALLAVFAAVQVLLGAGLWLTPGLADPGWIGPANLVSPLLATLLLGWMLRTEAEAPAR